MKNIKTIIITLLATVFIAQSSYAAGVSFYHTDPSGTPVRVTDETGKVVWHEVYKPFGEQQSIPTSTRPNSKRFIGKQLDSETGLLNVGVRYMKDGVGRFTSPDPVGPVDPMTSRINGDIISNPQKINAYVYGLNNPYKFIDPDGRHPLLTKENNSIQHKHRKQIPYTDPTKKQEDAYTQLRVKDGAVKTGKGGYYENCHADAYRPSEDVWINDPTVIIKDEYNEIPSSKITSGDRVTYYDIFGNPHHSGVVTGKDKIESKHGAAPKYNGPATATDKAYPGGVSKKYYRAK